MKPHVLVIGGGFAGIEVAKDLAQDFAVRVVDHKDYFEYTPSLLRALIQPPPSEDIPPRYSEISSTYGFDFMKGEVSTLTSSFAKINNGQSESILHFDYCVIAVEPKLFTAKTLIHGHTSQEYIESFDEVVNSIDEMDTILIEGGGPVAIELAAEIANTVDGKRIVLATPNHVLLKDFPCLAQIYAEAVLLEKGIEIWFETAIDEVLESKFDLVFQCSAPIFNTAFLKPDFESGLVDSGRIKVNSYLQMSHTIFAVGCVADTGLLISTTAFVAEAEAFILAQNIKALRFNTSLKTISAIPAFYSISLGPHLGMTILGDLVVPGRLQIYVKDLIRRFKLATFHSPRVSAVWKVIHCGLQKVGIWLR